LQKLLLLLHLQLILLMLHLQKLLLLLHLQMREQQQLDPALEVLSLMQHLEASWKPQQTSACRKAC